MAYLQYFVTLSILIWVTKTGIGIYLWGTSLVRCTAAARSACCCCITWYINVCCCSCYNVFKKILINVTINVLVSNIGKIWGRSWAFLWYVQIPFEHVTYCFFILTTNKFIYFLDGTISLVHRLSTRIAALKILSSRKTPYSIPLLTSLCALTVRCPMAAICCCWWWSSIWCFWASVNKEPDPTCDALLEGLLVTTVVPLDTAPRPSGLCVCELKLVFKEPRKKFKCNWI